jgi:aspartate kinase
MKFGGTSMGDLERIRRAARIVAAEAAAGKQVAVVVSAMAGKTNELVAWTDGAGRPGQGIALSDDEYDIVVASGEQVTAGLLALTLRNMGLNARSWMGWQIPILTDEAHGRARIEDVPGEVLGAAMDKGEIAVVPGFQGVSRSGRITTLGRGGSDTSAVAVAAALACPCDIYTDVDGVYTTDPRIESKARRLEKISYEEMLEMASLGAKVLQTRSVELAMRYKVRLRVLSSFEDTDENSGTLVCDEDEIMESKVVSGVAYSRDEAKMTLVTVEDRPGIAAAIFGPLAEAGVNVDMIVQNISEKNYAGHTGAVTDMTFSVPINQVARAKKAMEDARDAGHIKYDDLNVDTDVAKVSVVGIGMRSHAGVAAKMFAALAAENVNIKVIATSEIKISVLIDRKYMELAVQALHDAFELEKA